MGELGRWGALHAEGAASAELLGCAGALGERARGLEWRDGGSVGNEAREDGDQRTWAVGCGFSLQESKRQAGAA